MPCVVTCDAQNACTGVSCGEASSCEIHCKNGCTGDTRCGGTPGACTLACDTATGCEGRLLCSTNPASPCNVGCAAGACNTIPALCCGTPEAACTVAASFTKDTSTVCP